MICRQLRQVTAHIAGQLCFNWELSVRERGLEYAAAERTKPLLATQSSHLAEIPLGTINVFSG